MPSTNTKKKLTNSFHYTNTMNNHQFSLLLILFSLLLATSLASNIIDEYEGDVLIRQVVDDDDNLLNADHHFSLFKRRFGKSYGSQEEHHYRFSVFQANLRRAKRHQELDPSAVHGVTQFSDMTPEEFQQNHLGLNRIRFPSDAKKAPILPTKDLPTDFDWREHGAVTAVKNQVYRRGQH